MQYVGSQQIVTMATRLLRDGESLVIGIKMALASNVHHVLCTHTHTRQHSTRYIISHTVYSNEQQCKDKVLRSSTQESLRHSVAKITAANYY